MRAIVLNKCLFLFVLFAVMACNHQHEKTAETQAETQVKTQAKTQVKAQPAYRGGLPALADFIPPGQLVKSAGFANGKLFIAEPGKGLFEYDLREQTKQQVQHQVFAKEADLACQRFNSTHLDVMPLSTLLPGKWATFMVKAAICGNIQADMSPEVMVLLENDNKLILVAGTLDKKRQVEKWRTITAFNVAEPGRYLLLPEFSQHSAQGLYIAEYPEGGLKGELTVIQKLLPGDFIEPFDYRQTDHDEIWAAYINLDRASAKLMWNGGANSMAKLELYLTSIDPRLTKDPVHYFEQINTILTDLDPNRELDVALRLAEVYRDWKTNNLGRQMETL
ncbi:hypothetical protein [Thalassomonas sp. RHCl1]|uniref:hypothetical protein n=1 Tax=Thalassomonas sp. RHCl1 TaxID=2995320 RepID=UPI00248B269E|nr:hypothetical protein [Thalassomonas sp. RHCl1]